METTSIFRKLADDFERIALVDLDQAALDRNVSRLDASRTSAVLLRHTPFDLSGILPVLESWQAHRRPADEELSEVIAVGKDGSMSGCRDFRFSGLHLRADAIDRFGVHGDADGASAVR